MRKNPEDKEELLRLIKSRITVTDSGCWIYPSSEKMRYAKIIIGGKKLAVHRVMYELLIGPIQEALEVCHSCDVGHCCNPSHLFLGTHSENMRDMANKGRALSGDKWKEKTKHVNFSRPGILNGNSKLSIDDVRKIRISNDAARVMASEFGVSVCLIYKIRQNKLWRNNYEVV